MLALLLSLLSVWTTDSYAGECINWPRIMTQGAVRAASGGKIIVVEPFGDYTKQPGDEWMPAGLSRLLASMLSASSDLDVLAQLAAKYHPSANKPAYIISGMAQHSGDTLRIFIQVMTGETRQLLKQYEISTPYPENKQLFLGFADVTKQILDFVKAKQDGSELKTIRDITSSTRAYESYAKGRQSLETYNINEIEVAKTWFDETKRIDYRSPLGYLGKVDLFTFLGFYHKQRRESFGNYFEQAGQELADMKRLAKQPPAVTVPAKKSAKKEKTAVKLKNRFLLGQAAFKDALFAENGGDWNAAANAMRKAAEFVPEDAVAWYELSNIYTKTGNTSESSKSLQKALEINPCIEK